MCFLFCSTVSGVFDPHLSYLICYLGSLLGMSRWLLESSWLVQSPGKRWVQKGNTKQSLVTKKGYQSRGKVSILFYSMLLLNKPWRRPIEKGWSIPLNAIGKFGCWNLNFQKKLSTSCIWAVSGWAPLRAELRGWCALCHLIVTSDEQIHTVPKGDNNSWKGERIVGVTPKH
jgi:hypothetical protein